MSLRINLHRWEHQVDVFFYVQPRLPRRITKDSQTVEQTRLPVHTIYSHCAKRSRTFPVASTICQSAESLSFMAPSHSPGLSLSRERGGTWAAEGPRSPNESGQPGSPRQRYMLAPLPRGCPAGDLAISRITSNLARWIQRSCVPSCSTRPPPVGATTTFASFRSGQTYQLDQCPAEGRARAGRDLDEGVQPTGRTAIHEPPSRRRLREPETIGGAGR